MVLDENDWAQHKIPKVEKAKVKFAKTYVMLQKLCRLMPYNNNNLKT